MAKLRIDINTPLLPTPKKDKTYEGINLGAGSQYDKGLTSNIVEDGLLEDYRAENQSTSDKWLNGISKSVGKIGAYAIDGLGMLAYGIPSALLTGKLSNFYNNPISEATEEFSKFLDSELPHYYTDEEKNNWITSMTSSNFWADKALNGVAFLASAYLTGAGVGKALSLAGKAVGGAEMLSNAKSSATVLNELFESSTLSNLPKHIKGAVQKLSATAVESGVEARETYNTVKENIINAKLELKNQKGDYSDFTEQELAEIEEDALSAGNYNFATNMILTGSLDAIQFRNIFGKKYSARIKDYNRIKTKDGKYVAEELTKSQKFLQGIGKETWENVGSEALQELSQNFSNKLFTDYYSSADGDKSLINSGYKAMEDTFTTQEGIESGILGAVIGGLGWAGKRKILKQKSELSEREAILQKEVQKLNNLDTDIKKRNEKLTNGYIVQQELNKAKNKSVQEGDRFTYETLNDADYYNTVTTKIRTGKIDEFLTELENNKNLSDAEFVEAWGESASKITNRTAFIDELKDRAVKIDKNYNDLIENYGHRINENDIEKIAFIKSMSDQFVNRDTQIKQKLKDNFGLDYDTDIIGKYVKNGDLNEQEKLIKDFTKTSNDLKSKIDIKKEKAQTLKITDELDNLNVEIKNLQKEYNKSLNDIDSIQKVFKDAVTDGNYTSVFAKLSESARNKLKEKEERTIQENGKLDPTTRQEFTELIKDLNKINKVKDSFINLHNEMISPNTSEETLSKLNKQIKDNINNNQIKEAFSVKSQETKTEIDEDGKEKNIVVENDVELDKGYYTSKLNAKTYSDPETGDTRDIKLADNIIEILDRRISEEGVAEILVSENNKEAKWENVGKFENMDIHKLKNEFINQQKQFFLQHKDSVIKIRVKRGYTREDVKNINGVRENGSTIFKKSADKRIPINFQERFKQTPEEKLNNEDADFVEIETTLGLDNDGNIILRQFNAETGKFEKLDWYEKNVRYFDKVKPPMVYFTPYKFNPNDVISIISEEKSKEKLEQQAYEHKFNNWLIKQRELQNKIDKLKKEKSKYKNSTNLNTDVELIELDIQQTQLDLQDVNLEIQELEEFLKYAFYDSRRRYNKVTTNVKFGIYENLDEEIEIAQELGEELKNPLPHINHNDIIYKDGAFIDGVNLDSPFMKTTTKNVNNIADFDKKNNYEKSQIIFNNLIPNLDLSKHLVEITDKLPDDYVNDYPNKELDEQSEDTVPLYVILTDLQGNRLKFNSVSKVDNKNGYYAIQTLPTPKLRTESVDENGKQISNARFRDITSNIDYQPVQDAFKERRKAIIADLKAGNKHYLKINGKSLGITNKEDKVKVGNGLTNYINKLKDVVKFNFKNKNERLIIANSKTTQIGDKIYDTIAGAVYYVNTDTDLLIPLQTKLLDDKNIEYIRKLILDYHDTVNSNYENVEDKTKLNLYYRDKVYTPLLKILHWGFKAKDSNKSYEIDFLDESTKKDIVYKKKGDKEYRIVTLDDMRNKTESYLDFAEFLKTIRHNVSKTNLEESFKFLEKGGESYYVDNLLENVLTSNVIKNSNSSGQVIKPQYSNAYLRFGKQTTPQEEVKEDKKKQVRKSNRVKSSSSERLSPEEQTLKADLESEYATDAQEFIINNNSNTKKTIQELKLDKSEENIKDANEQLNYLRNAVKFLSILNNEGKKLLSKPHEQKLNTLITELELALGKEVKTEKKSKGFNTSLKFEEDVNKTDDLDDLDDLSQSPKSEGFVADNQETETKPTKSNVKKALNNIKKAKTPIKSDKTDESTDRDNLVNMSFSRELDEEPKISDPEFEKAKKRIKELYDINVEKVVGLIKGNAFGAFVNSAKVLISDVAPVGTAYHEEFHIVEKLYLTDRQKKDTYDKYRKITDENLPDEEVSEKLAEAFRYYAINRDIEEGKLKRSFIQKFIESLYKFIENLLKLSKDKSFNKLFDSIYTGELANLGELSISEKNLKSHEIQAFNKAIENLSYKLLENNDDLRYRVLDEDDFTDAFTYEISKTDRDNINNKIYKNFIKSEIYQTLEESEALSKAVKKEIKPENANIILAINSLMLIYSDENSQNLEEVINENFNEIIENYIKYLNIKGLSKVELESENEIDETSLQLNAVVNANSNETDYINKPVSFVKTILSSITKTNDKGDVVYNNLGLQESIDQNYYLRMLQEDTQDIETWEEFIEVLESKPSNSVYQKMLELFTQYDDLEFHEFDFKDKNDVIFYTNVLNGKNAILGQFAKSKLDYYEHKIDENGNYKIVNKSGYYGKKKILDEASSAFNIERQKGNFVKDGKLKQSVIDKVKKLTQNVEQKNELSAIQDRLNFLKSIGFTFSNPNFYNINGIKDELKSIGETATDFNNKLKYFLNGWINKSNTDITYLNPFTDADKIDSLDALLKIEDLFRESDYNSAFLNGKNKTIFPFQLQSTLSKIVKKLRNERVEFANLKLVALSDFKNAEGKVIQISQLPAKSRYLVNYMSVMFNNVYPFIFDGSRSMSYGLKDLLPPIDKTTKSNNSYFEILIHEANQISQNLNDSEIGIKVFNSKNKSKQFGIMKDIIPKNILDIIYEDIKNNKTINAEYLYGKSFGNKLLYDVIDNYVEKHIEKKLSQHKKFIEDNDIIIPKDYSNDFQLRQYVINTEYSNWLQTKYIAGDLAYHKDFLKRVTAATATRKNFNLSESFLNQYNEIVKSDKFKGVFGKYAKTLVIDDVTYQQIESEKEDVNKNIYDYLIKEGIQSSVAKAYLENNMTDAQSYENIHAYKFRLIAEGGWSESKDRIFEKIINNQDLTGNDIIEFSKEEDGYLNVQKPQAYSFTDEGVPFMFKTSVLIPQLVKGSQLEVISKMMDETGTSYIPYESAIKVGRKVNNQTEKGIQLFDVDGQLRENIDVNDFEDYYQYFDLNYFGTQVEVNDKPKQKILTGTQQRAMIKSNIFRITDKEWVKNTLDKLDNLEVAKIELQTKALKKRLGISDDVIEDPTVLIEILTNESKKRELPISFVEDITYLLNNNLTLDIIARKNKLESVLTAIVSAEIIKVKRKGDSKAQVSSVGFASFDKSDIQKNSDLKFYQNENGKFTMEVYLPSFLSEYVNLSQEIQLTDDENGDNPLFQIIGFRIPTQGLNSIESIKIKGFLPEVMGNTIAVPKQLTAKAGSDFDIDKLNLYFPNYYVNDKNKSIYIKPYTDEKELIKDYEEYLELSKTKNKDSFEDFKIKAIDNAILATELEILARPENKLEILTPNTDYNIKGIAKGQNNEEYPNNESVRSLSGNNVSENDIDLIDSIYLMKRQESFNVGKSVLGQYALQLKHHVLSQIADLKIANFQGINFENFKNTKGSLSEIYDSDGNLITKNLEEPENASVDVEKDDYLLDVNVNDKTVAIAAYLTRLGLPLAETYLFLSQPILKGIDITKIDRTYEPVKFTKENLKEQLQNPSYDFQMHILEEYKKYEIEANKLNELIKITQFDTKGIGTSFAANAIFENDYNKFIKSNVANSKNIPYFENVDRFFKRGDVQTHLGYLKDIVFESNKYFSTVFKIDDILDELELDYNFKVRQGIYNDKFSSRDDKIKALNLVKNELLTYIVRNIGNKFMSVARNGESLNISQRTDLIKGDKTLAKRLQLIKSNPKNKLNDNLLIQRLEPIVRETITREVDNNIETISYDSIALKNSNGITTQESNMLFDAWFELNTIKSELVEDLIITSILEQGFKNSINTYHNIIPAELLEKVIYKFYTPFNIDYSNFEKQLVINNYYANLIVGKGEKSIDYKYINVTTKANPSIGVTASTVLKEAVYNDEGAFVEFESTDDTKQMYKKIKDLKKQQGQLLTLVADEEINEKIDETTAIDKLSQKIKNVNC